MFQAITKVTVKHDLTPDIKKSLSALAKKKVYVGIPQKNSSVHGKSEIKSAELLYILTHGVRSKEMISEMNDMMGIEPNGMPFTEAFEKFSANQTNGMPYSEAYQMYIQAHGSPLWRIPPRPVLEPAIEYNKKAISKQMRKAADAALSGKDPEPALHAAGMLGQNVSREWFTNPENKWPPNSPKTIDKKGSDKPLIDTGALRQAITYVIRG